MRVDLGRNNSIQSLQLLLFYKAAFLPSKLLDFEVADAT